MTEPAAGCPSIMLVAMIGDIRRVIRNLDRITYAHYVVAQGLDK